VNEAKIPVYYFGHIISVLSKASINVEDWLKSQRLSLENILEVDASITNYQFESLLLNLLRDEGLAHLGLLVGQRLQIAHHGFFGIGLANCENLRQSLLFQKSFLSMRIPNIEIRIEQGTTHTQIVMIDQLWQGAMHRTVMDAVVTALLNVINGYKLENTETIRDLRLSLDYEKPTYFKLYDQLAVAEVIFSQTNCMLSVPNQLLQIKIKGVDQISYLQAELVCKKAIAENNVSPPLDYLVERTLERSIFSAVMSLEDVAAKLHMSSRSLNRQLKMRNTGYKQILDNVRKKAIIECLQHKQMSITQTALTLGYSDLANFRRAFKRMFNLGPKEYLLSAQQTQSKHTINNSNQYAIERKKI